MRPFSLAISRTDMNRLAVIFVEGDTEVDFYKKLVSYYRNQHGGRLSCRVEIRNVRGVGNKEQGVKDFQEKHNSPISWL